jgi:Uma2 family endonuclease
MVVAATAHRTEAEYLAWEAQQTDKHEFVRGELFAMVGVSRRHATVAGNMFTLLRARLQDGPCRAYMSDMKLRVETAGAFYYPDVFVTCDPRDHRADDFMSSAVLIVEILSPSTAAYDRGEKFASYRKLLTLSEYLLIDPDRKRIECFRRNESGRWVLHEPGEDHSMSLQSVDLRLDEGSVFRDVDDPPA